MRRIVFYILILLVVIFIVGLSVFNYLKLPKRIKIVKHFSFSTNNALEKWKEKIFNGRVIYKVKHTDCESFVIATSKGTASALYYKIKLDIDKNPVISWKWNARKFPAKDGLEKLSDAKMDDFAARVYVIFPGLFFTNSKAIEYIWAERIKEGTVSPSPYSKNLQLIVVESGRRDKEWVYEERNIYKDYIMAFKEKPRFDVGAIAFMTDADSTESIAEAFYDEIEIGYLDDKKGAR